MILAGPQANHLPRDPIDKNADAFGVADDRAHQREQRVIRLGRRYHHAGGGGVLGAATTAGGGGRRDGEIGRWRVTDSDLSGTAHSGLPLGERCLAHAQRQGRRGSGVDPQGRIDRRPGRLMAVGSVAASAGARTPAKATIPAASKRRCPDRSFSPPLASQRSHAPRPATVDNIDTTIARSPRPPNQSHRRRVVKTRPAHHFAPCHCPDTPSSTRMRPAALSSCPVPASGAWMTS